MKYLNVREAGGYSLHTEQFYSKTQNRSFPVYVFRATESNELFIRDEDPEDTAVIIAYSHGPSGPNKEYLFSLYDWHKENYPDIIDEHLEILVSATRRKLKK